MAVNQATGYNRTTNEPLDALFLNSGSVYASTTEVNSKVNITVRYTGSMFNVNGELYWYKDGVQDSDLVLFRVASASYAATASGADNFVVRNDFTASGLNYPSVDNGEESFIQTDGNGNLTLQYVKTIYEEVYNGEATTLVKGTPVYVSGSVGSASKVYRADAGNASKMPVVYVIPDNLAPGQVGKGIALGLIKGIDTTGYPAGTEIYLAVGGGWTSTRPTGSAVIQVLGYVTKEGNGGQGVVLNPGPASLPNVAFGNVWVGNENGYPTAQSTSSLHVDSASYAQNTTSAATASSADQFTIRTVPNATTDTDKFIVLDGIAVKYRTGAEVLSDINAQPSGSYITSLTNEVVASGPGAASATLLNSAVTGKVLTGLNITGGTILATDTILQAFGKAQNQITGLMGGATYQGVWNASTNSPTITSSTGTKGHYYVVNIAGSTNIDGITDWKVGDWIIFNGTNWDKVDNTDAVSSVNGQVGAVSLTTANIPEVTNLYYTDTRAKAAISSSATGLSYNNSTGVFTLTSGYVIPTTTQETNWTLAYTQTRQWDGGATGLNAATGRTSLGLGSMALENTGSYYTQTQINNFFAGTTAITGYNRSNWDAVYAWYQTGPLTGLITAAHQYYIGTTLNALNRASGAQTLTGVSIDGNAATATTWQTARTLTIGNTGKSVDGSGNVSWSLAEIGAAPSVAGGYLPLSGGTLTGNLGIGTSPSRRLEVSTSVSSDAAQNIARFAALNGSSEYKTFDIGYIGSTNLITLGTNAVGTDPSMSFRVGVTEVSRFASSALTSYVPINGTSLSMSGGAAFATSSGDVLIAGATTDGTNKLIVNGGVKVSGTNDLTVGGIYRDYQGEALMWTNTSAVTQIGSGGASVGRELQFLAGNATRLTIASTGAATFSSSVTASSFSGAGTGLTGTASSLTAGNSLLWGGQTYNGSIAAAIQFALVYDNTVAQFRLAQASGLQSFLGLNTAAYVQANQNLNTGSNVTFNTVYASGNITAYSDIRLKTNIQSIQDPIQKLMMLNGFTYSRNDIADKSKRFIGLSAQDVISAGLTEAVEINDKGMYSVAYGNLAASLLVEVGKNHEQRIQELESKLLAYENKFGKLN